jgi:hypothetical protein
MFFALAVFIWVIPISLATFVRSAGSPGTSLLLYALAIAWLPVVVIAWLRLRRARPN